MARMWPMSPARAVRGRGSTLAVGDRRPRRSRSRPSRTPWCVERRPGARRCSPTAIDVDVAARARPARPKRSREHVRHGIAVPARHDRRADRAPGVDVDRPGHADADREHVARRARPASASSRVEASDRASRARGRGRHAIRNGSSRSASGTPAEVADGEALVAGSQVGGEDDAHVLVEGQRDGRTPAAGFARLHPRRRRSAASSKPQAVQ